MPMQNLGGQTKSIMVFPEMTYCRRLINFFINLTIKYMEKKAAKKETENLT